MRTALVAPLVVLLLVPALARPVPADLASQVQEIQLANGMKFLFVKRAGSGVFSAFVRVKVGGADERVGETGVAHLFEHMAFKGTSVIGTSDWPREREVLRRVHDLGEELAAEQARRGRADPKKVQALQAKLKAAVDEERQYVKKDEFTEILLRNGAANLNATTDKDMTSYYMSLPKNRLELWALMEAQRFAGPVMREFYSERDVVMEERRMRTDTSPTGLMFEALNATAFDNSPYRWPTVGWMEDLNTLSIADSMELRHRSYVPANVVGAVVGDLDESELRAVLERTFGAIPKGPEPQPIKAVEPPQRGEKRRVVRFAASPQLLMAFHKPTLPDHDDYVFDVIDQVLSGGRTSRLYKRLVLEKKLASDVYTFGGPGSRLDNLFYVGAVPLPGVDVTALEREIEVVLAGLGTRPPPEDELRRVRNQIETDQLRGLATNEGLASSLSYFQTVAGDWRYLITHGDELQKVSAEDVARVARAYLIPENRTVVTLEPPAPAAGPEARR